MSQKGGGASMRLKLVVDRALIALELLERDFDALDIELPGAPVISNYRKGEHFNPSTTYRRKALAEQGLMRVTKPANERINRHVKPYGKTRLHI
jgi:hypothetical protein